MTLYFVCSRDKKHVLIDVDESAKVETLQDIIRQLLRLPNDPRLMKCKSMEPSEFDELKPDQPLSLYNFNEETASVSDPAELYYLLPEDKLPVITELSALVPYDLIEC